VQWRQPSEDQVSKMQHWATSGDHSVLSACIGSIEMAWRAGSSAANTPIKTSATADSAKTQGLPGFTSNKKLRTQRGENCRDPSGQHADRDQTNDLSHDQREHLRTGCAKGHAHANLAGAPRHIPSDLTIDTALRSFASSLMRDQQAVEAALTLPWSNGVRSKAMCTGSS
jgi:hypothetical protein